MCLLASVTWTKEESEALRQAVKECLSIRHDVKMVNVFYNLPWLEIAEKVQTKTGDQCRNHW